MKIDVVGLGQAGPGLARDSFPGAGVGQGGRPGGGGGLSASGTRPSPESPSRGRDAERERGLVQGVDVGVGRASAAKCRAGRGRVHAQRVQQRIRAYPVRSREGRTAQGWSVRSKTRLATTTTGALLVKVQTSPED